MLVSWKVFYQGPGPKKIDRNEGINIDTLRLVQWKLSRPSLNRVAARFPVRARNNFASLIREHQISSNRRYFEHGYQSRVAASIRRNKTNAWTCHIYDLSPLTVNNWHYMLSRLWRIIWVGWVTGRSLIFNWVTGQQMLCYQRPLNLPVKDKWQATRYVRLSKHIPLTEHRRNKVSNSFLRIGDSL